MKRPRHDLIAPTNSYSLGLLCATYGHQPSCCAHKRLERRDTREAVRSKVIRKCNCHWRKNKLALANFNGDVSYNWRIIMTPHHIGDCVLVYELWHMLQHTH